MKHKCKFHGYSHDYVRHDCGHEYCPFYWIACPRCHGSEENNQHPQPNENGVYDSGHPAVEFIRCKVKGASCAVRLLAVGSCPRWLEGHTFEYHCGDYHGTSSPLTEHETFPTRLDALRHTLDLALRHFDPARLDAAVCGSCVTDEQRRVSGEMHRALRQLLELHCGVRVDAPPKKPAQSTHTDASQFDLFGGAR